MDIQKLISVLQERNRERFIQKFANGNNSLKADLQKLFVQDITTDTAHQVALAVIEEYDDIFKWLLGEKGDFPDLSQKPHYSFRIELRKKLDHLKTLEAKIKDK